MSPKESRGQGGGSRSGRGGGGGQGTSNAPEIGAAAGANPLQPGANPYTPGASNPYAPGATHPYAPGASNPYAPGATNPYAPGASNPYAPGASPPRPPVAPPAQNAISRAPREGTRIQPRPDEDPAAFQRRLAAREQMSRNQAARRARMRAAQEAEVAEEGEDPRRKIPRGELVVNLNACAARVTRSAVERDEELINCPHCARGKTWPLKCHGGDECIECEAREIKCVRGNKKNFDIVRARQREGVEEWRPDTDQCRQCKSRGCQCWMPNMRLAASCEQCTADGLPCIIEPLQVRRCPTCHWEHKCIECARNHLRCDGQTPCLVCLRKKISCVGLKPDGSCPDIPMSTYGTGLPPNPIRTAVLTARDAKWWPPPSGRLDIPGDRVMPGVPGYQVINFGLGLPGHQVLNFGLGPPGVAGPVPLPAAGPAVGIFSPPPVGPVAGSVPGSSPILHSIEGSPPVGAGPGYQAQQPLPRVPGFDLRNFRNSLYNPFDDDKPPCSWCAADVNNRICDQGTPCFECTQRGITEREVCRTTRPCELCFMNEMPCDIGSPCQHCMFLGFGADECRPEGLSMQRYFPENEPYDSDDEPYIHLPGVGEVPEFEYSCAFCVAYGLKGCDPRDRPCLACVANKRTALQCRFEERCNRCIELDAPCDGKMPCSLCATADGLTSMMCLGRGDRTLPDDNNGMPAEGEDIPMGEAGDYPALAGLGYEFSPRDANNPFSPAQALGEYIDPAVLIAHGPPGQSILPQPVVPLVPPGGFFDPPAHVRANLLPHYRVRADVHNNGHFNPVPGGHISWGPWNDGFRCKVTLPDGMPCGALPAIDCDGGEEHGDEEMRVCGGCRKTVEESTAYLMEEIEAKKNLFCCATCSQAQMNKFNSGTGFENMETLVDYHCDCDTQMRSWLCFDCRYKVIHAVGDRMITTRELLTRDSDNAILCPRCGVEPGNKEASYHLAKGVARCSSCWHWINYAR